MKRKFTLLIAALALLTMIVQPGRAWGQSDYSTDYTGNITLSTTGGTSASSCKVKINSTDYNGIKAGTGSVFGAVKITVPAATKYLHMHVAGWNNENVTLTVAPTGYTEDIALTSNSGISGNSPFTFSGDPSTSSYYKVITFTDALAADTDLTFTATGGKRFVVWGVTSEEGGGSTLLDNDLALTGAPIELEFDLYNNNAAQVINYTTSSSGAVTIADNNYVEAVINEDNKTITVTPLSITNGIKTITVNQATDNIYKAGLTTFTVNITDSTPYAGGDVTFVAGTDKGSTTTQGADEMTKSGITVYSTSAALATSEYRFYSGSTTTISTANGIITSIEFTEASGSYPISRFSTTTGSYENGIWTGNASSIDFSASGQVRVSQIVVTVTTSSDPYITASDVNIAYDAVAGEIEYTVNNPASGGVLTATTESNWLTIGTVGATVPFTCGVNPAATERAATVTLTYTYDAKATVTKDVTVTQAGNPDVYMTISEVRAQGTGSVTTKGIVTSCVGTTGYIQDNDAAICVYGSSLTVGDEIRVSGSLTTYNGLLEITSPQVTVVSSGNVVDPEVMTVAEAVASTNQGWYIRIENATVSAISGSNTTIAQGESTIVVRGISGVTLAVNDIISLNGNIGCFNANQIANPQDVTVQQPTEPTITLSSYAINVAADGENGSIEVTFENFTDLEPEIQFFEADGVTPASYTWMTAGLDAENEHVTYQIAANDGAARTAYFKVYEGSEGIYSNLVTVSQAAYIAPTYAALPFAFNGGRDDIEDTDGLYQEGLGTDYSGDNPKLKFDNTGDWVLLQFDERPGTLTFDIKNNSFSGGTFTVQTSEDGATYTDLKNYTTITGTQNEEFDNLGENVRYIKWIYTNKDSGNVGLGNIGLTAYVAPSPAITLETYAIDVDAGEHIGEIGVTYQLVEEDLADIYYCDADGNPATYDWFTAEVNANHNVDYVIGANTTTAERTAYFKVYGLDNIDYNDVYSDIVTITQEGIAVLYTVMFDTDGGTFVGNDDFNSEIVQKQTGVYSLPSATKNNVTFAGWKLDGTDDIYAAGAQYEVTADASFTAQWSNATTGTIHFCSTAGTGNMNINTSPKEGTDDIGNTWTVVTEGTTSFTPSNNYCQIGSGSKPATSITFTMTLPNDVTISTFSAKFGGNSGTAGDITLKVGETTVGTGSLNASTDVIVNSTSIVYGNVLTVTVTNIAKGVKAYYISYSYEMGTDPIIIASSPVDLAYNATSGEIEYSIINPATGVSLDATTIESWISNFVITDDKVTFTTTENTEYISRQGTITLSYQGANNVDVLVNQAAAPMPMDDFALFTGDLVEGDYIIYYDGKALNTTVTSNRLQYAAVTPANNVIATDNSDIIWHITPNGEYWTVYNATADAYAASTGTKNQAQMMSDGTDDKALWTVTGTETYEFVNKYNSENSINANLRNNGTYGFACYATGTGGALTLYKRASAIASYKTVIAGYGDNEGGYCLIASPVSADPTNVTNMMTEQAENYDLYWFDQANDEAQWRNYKANSFYLTPGKGYLYARNSDAELTFNGLEYEGNGTINLTYADGATFDGWNLIGNPFGTNTVLDRVYYRMNSAGDGFVAATENTPINKMEGVFVKATGAGQSATFTPSNSKDSKAIAKTNIMVANANGTVVDNVIIRFDGGRTLEKFSFRDGNTKLYIPQDDADYAIVNSNATGEVSLYFKAATTGNYTISMKQSDADLGYLHLIDRLTGADVNMLLDDYTFVGSPRDTENRFIVRFSENSNGMAENNYFAYQNGDQIIVNGNGELQVFDATGRMVMNTNVNGIQTVNVPATGMYIFRMVGESVQTQKIVVR
ncbi:MAG: InlB B-repeat-containing protein [Bacteroidales bacterium]|nr:InlB B-repeat-containing protein [Bacteroidales bacterium]